MSFVEALQQFQMEIEKEYGTRNPVVKIALTPDALQNIVSHLYAGTKYFGYNIKLTLGETVVCGVQLVARQKDDF